MTAETTPARTDILPTLEDERKLAAQIGIATMTFYPRFGEQGENARLDNLRGKIALQMIKKSVTQGHPIAVAEGGSSDAFKAALAEIKGADVINPKDENEDTFMSGSRRAGYKFISRKEGVKAIAWVEPEKEPLINSSFIDAGAAIIDGGADIVVPHRPSHRKGKGFDSLPPTQRRFEQDRFNPMFRNILKRFGGVKKRIEDYDISFGPKIFRNDPEIIKYFLAKHEYKKKTPHDNVVNPEKWSNTLTLPVAAALLDGRKVVSVYVDYTHPKDMTELETGNKDFDVKRPHQLQDQMRALIEFCKFYKSKIKSVAPEAQEYTLKELLDKEVETRRQELAKAFDSLVDKPTFVTPGEVSDVFSMGDVYSYSKVTHQLGLVLDKGNPPKRGNIVDEDTRPGLVLYPSGGIYKLPYLRADETDTPKLDNKRQEEMNGYGYLVYADRAAASIKQLQEVDRNK